MIPLVLFTIALCTSLIHIFTGKIRRKDIAAIFLLHFIVFNIGVMGLITFYTNVFMAETTAKLIGWPPGSPFQTEIGMANLSYGVLGILSIWLRKGFWTAAVIGYSVFLLGMFALHMVLWSNGEAPPYTLKGFIWFNDFFIPLILLSLLGYKSYAKEKDS